MKSEVTTKTYPYQVWDQAYLGVCFPGGAPHSSGTITQTSSNDLEISFNNKQRSRMTRIDAQLNVIPGQPFKVTKRDYKEWSTLGANKVHVIERKSQGACHDAIMAPQFARVSSFTNASFPNSGATSFSTLELIGRDAISRVAPTASQFSAAEFLGELREGAPNALGLAHSAQGRLARAKNAGSEYLNVEYGWKPLVSDISNFVDAVENGNAILDKYYEGAGKVQKLGYHYPDELTYTIGDSGTGYYPIPNNGNTWMFSGSGRLLIETKTSRKRWFEGAFTYTLPNRDSFRGKYSGMRKRFGVDITPELAWELTPWSWAADWVSDAGVLAKNLSAFQTDGLVMPWAFMMEETSVTTTYQLMGVRYNTTSTGITGTHNFFQSFTTTTKQRVPASPFGFGLTWNGFSQRQLAILAAAGIQRL